MNEYTNPLAAAWTEVFIGRRVCSKGCKEALTVPALGELAVSLSSLWRVPHVLFTTPGLARALWILGRPLHCTILTACSQNDRLLMSPSSWSSMRVPPSGNNAPGTYTEGGKPCFSLRWRDILEGAMFSDQCREKRDSQQFPHVTCLFDDLYLFLGCKNKPYHRHFENKEKGQIPYS